MDRLGQGAEIEAAVDPAARLVADGHPLGVGLVRGREALAPQTFVARGVVLGAALPGVVGDSWSSQVTMNGAAACSACRSGSVLYWACRRR